MFQARYVLGKPRFRTSLYHVDQARSAPLEPPWPDLILTVGRRPSMAALWVKEQARGRAALVVVGRPKRWLDRFDLVIAPPQFQLPRRANVLRLDLPLDAGRRGRDRRRERGMARALRRSAAAAHRAARGRADQAVPLRSGGRRAADGERPARRAARGRLTIRHHQPPHAGDGGRRRSRPSCRPARAFTAGTTAAPTPTTRCSGSPTGSSSPATASR